MDLFLPQLQRPVLAGRGNKNLGQVFCATVFFVRWVFEEVW
jgi:hypothetical protein